MSRKEETFVDDFGKKIGEQLKEINNKSTSQRTLASLAQIDKDMVTRIFNGEIKSFRVLVALMAVIFESRAARPDDKEGQEKDDIHRFFTAMEQSFRECLEVYEDTPDFAPRTYFGRFYQGICAIKTRKPMGKYMSKSSRLMALLKKEIRQLYERECFEKKKLD